MADGEQVSIEIKQIKQTKDGKKNYIHAIDEDTGNFFMANISPQQAVDLEGIKYAIMKCSGHSEKDGKLFFYYDFDVITPDDNGNANESWEDKPVDLHAEFAYNRYSLDDMEADLREINHRIRVALDDVDFDWKYECIRKVQDDVVDALAVIYKNKLKTGDVQ
jgi:hypothetical protein